jgi:hypothetical protein
MSGTEDPVTEDSVRHAPGGHASIAPEWGELERALWRVTENPIPRPHQGSVSTTAVAGPRTKSKVLSRAEVQRAATLEHAKTGAVLDRIASLHLDSLGLSDLSHPDDKAQNAPLSVCPRLRQLTIRYNPLEAASVPRLQGAVLDALPELRELSVESCGIDVAPKLNHLKLEYLSLASNTLRAMCELSLQKLTALDLSGQGPSFTAFNAASRLPSLTSLDISRNGFVNLESISGFSGLQTLSASANRLVNLTGIEKMAHLEKLDVSNNRLRYSKVLSTSNPLRVCAPTLTTLDVSSNEIASLAFFVSMPKLWWLDVSANLFGGTSFIEPDGSAQPSTGNVTGGRSHRDDIGTAAYDEDDAEVASTAAGTKQGTKTHRTAASEGPKKTSSSATVKPGAAGSVKSVVTRTTTNNKPPRTSAAEEDAAAVSGAAAGPFLQRIATLFPAVEFLDISRTSGLVLSAPIELAPLGKCKRLGELRVDASLVESEIERLRTRKEAAAREALEARRRQRAAKKADTLAAKHKSSAGDYESRMRAAFDFGGDAPAPVPAAAAAGAAPSAAGVVESSDDSDNELLDVDVDQQQVLRDVVASVLPALERLNGEATLTSTAVNDPDAEALAEQLGDGAGPRLLQAQPRRPMTARSAANAVLQEEEILSQVLDAATLAALREIGFDANQAAAAASAASASNRPGSATGLRRPGSAGGGGGARPSSAAGTRASASATATAKAAMDVVSVRRELEHFVDEIHMSQDYVAEALGRVESRIRWAYGDAKEPAAEAVYRPMHEYWESTSAARSHEMEADLAQQREMRRQRKLDEQRRGVAGGRASTPEPKTSTSVATGGSRSPDAASRPPAAKPVSPAPPAKTPSKPTASRAASSPRAPSSTAAQPASAVTRVTTEVELHQARPRPSSHDDRRRSRSSGGGSSGGAPLNANNTKPADGGSSAFAQSASTSFASASTSGAVPAVRPVANRPGPEGAPHPSTPPNTRGSRSKSFAEEQAAFKQHMALEADLRRQRAIPRAAPARAAPKRVDGGTMTGEAQQSDSRSMFDRMGTPAAGGVHVSGGPARRDSVVGTDAPQSPVDADPLAKYRLRPVESSASTVTEPREVSHAPTGTPTVTAPKRMTNKPRLEGATEVLTIGDDGAEGDDDASSVGDVSSSEDSTNGQPSPTKNVVVTHDRRRQAKTAHDDGEQHATPAATDMLRPSSASIRQGNTRRREGPVVDSGNNTAVAFTVLPKRVAEAVGANGKSTRVKVSSNGPILRTGNGILAPVTGDGQRAPAPSAAQSALAKKEDGASRVVVGGDARGQASPHDDAPAEKGLLSEDPYKIHLQPALRRAGGSLNGRRR